MEIIGRLYTKAEADQEFGNIIRTVPLTVNILNDLLTKTQYYIMFQIIEDKIVVLDNIRNVIYPEESTVDSTQVFILYSTNMVTELINTGGGLVVDFEKRNNVFTITYDQNTLELGQPCPPYCYTD